MKIKDVINRMVLILLLMVIIISTPLYEIIILIFFYIMLTYIITNLNEEYKAKLDVIEAVFSDDEYGYGSKVDTIKHARQINKHFTTDDIDLFS